MFIGDQTSKVATTSQQNDGSAWLKCRAFEMDIVIFQTDIKVKIYL